MIENAWIAWIVWNKANNMQVAGFLFLFILVTNIRSPNTALRIHPVYTFYPPFSYFYLIRFIHFLFLASPHSPFYHSFISISFKHLAESTRDLLPIQARSRCFLNDTSEWSVFTRMEGGEDVVARIKNGQEKLERRGEIDRSSKRSKKVKKIH